MRGNFGSQAGAKWLMKYKTDNWTFVIFVMTEID